MNKRKLAKRVISATVDIASDKKRPAHERLHATQALFSLMPTTMKKTPDPVRSAAIKKAWKTRRRKHGQRKRHNHVRNFVLKDQRHLKILKQYLEPGDMITLVKK